MSQLAEFQFGIVDCALVSAASWSAFLRAEYVHHSEEFGVLLQIRIGRIYRSTGHLVEDIKVFWLIWIS
jgi:hypothetical protein